ncbi:MAG: hypothetical protein AB8D78_14105 [Akkermansiaceae bacterium]
MKNFLVSGMMGASLLLAGCGAGDSEAKVSEPGRELVMESIAAHGGTDNWYNSGQLQFRWKYHLTDKGPEAVVDTVQTFDPKTMAVLHEVEGEDIRFGMNGGTVWIEPDGAEFSPPPRFWALTPVYFLGLPFVLNDPSANFEQLPEMMEFEGGQYAQVKVTFDASAGDTPDDYYVLLIDPETKLTRGAYYIVTSELVAPDGPGPAKFITLDELQDVGGVKLASGHRTFKMAEGNTGIGEQMRFTEVSGVKWLPEGAIDLSLPK